ncbi:SDR family NAD(P)-dependent oxidoreductase [Rhodococcus sp. 14-2470-1a]|uniref:SDR family NAD(P)-dependent oxidoreductase n=1 Tax=Rhodococcus sp. 14-2470-1a TaxID=2023150 RepID=UPI000B9B3438|nr:SDR family oxidoreductase [Rhodococcus sp. 14-2470-1a]OZF45966.1 short-chain dehydrogenase [Rhodococcus sp. 14-2470-1a]
MTVTLQDRRILVTGAATGIGAAAVEVLTAAGARVVGTHHNTPPPTSTDASWIHCDVVDEQSVAECVARAVEILGGIDVLVHAAGLWEPGVPGKIDGANIRRMIDINFSATVITNQAVYAVMRKSGGQIINFGSSEGVSGSGLSATYAAAKAAVHTWTRSAARSWAKDGVTVNALAPAVQTPGADRRTEFIGPEAAAQFEKQLQVLIPLGGKLGDPIDDLGPVLAFLAGDGARFMTGQMIAVNGGLLMLGA